MIPQNILSLAPANFDANNPFRRAEFKAKVVIKCASISLATLNEWLQQADYHSHPIAVCALFAQAVKELKRPRPPLEWRDLFDTMDAYPSEWIETTEDMYFEMLECLPPRAMAKGAFMVGEPLRHGPDGAAIHACFKQKAGRFFAKNLTLAQFHAEV